MKSRKKPRNQSLLRLRQIIGMTQKAFSVHVGLSLDLIKGIESGRNKLSQSAIHHIFMATGVDGASLARGDGRPLCLTGTHEYTKAHFDDWNNRLFPSNEETAWEQFESIVAPHMLLLMLAATRRSRIKNTQGRLPGLLESWVYWEREAVARFDLEPQIKEILDRFPIIESKTMSWGDWRKQIRWEAENFRELQKKGAKISANIVPDFTKKWWGFRDNPKKEDSEMLTLKATPRYEFVGGLYGMKDILEKLKTARGTINKG